MNNLPFLKARILIIADRLAATNTHGMLADDEQSTALHYRYWLPSPPPTTSPPSSRCTILVLGDDPSSTPSSSTAPAASHAASSASPASSATTASTAPITRGFEVPPFTPSFTPLDLELWLRSELAIPRDRVIVGVVPVQELWSPPVPLIFLHRLVHKFQERSALAHAIVVPLCAVLRPLAGVRVPRPLPGKRGDADAGAAAGVAAAAAADPDRPDWIGLWELRGHCGDTYAADSGTGTGTGTGTGKDNQTGSGMSSGTGTRTDSGTGGGRRTVTGTGTGTGSDTGRMATVATAAGLRLVDSLRRYGYATVRLAPRDRAVVEAAYRRVEQWVAEQRALSPSERWRERVNPADPTSERFVGYAADAAREWLQMRAPRATGGVGGGDEEERGGDRSETKDGEGEGKEREEGGGGLDHETEKMEKKTGRCRNIGDYDSADHVGHGNRGDVGESRRRGETPTSAPQRRRRARPRWPPAALDDDFAALMLRNFSVLDQCARVCLYAVTDVLGLDRADMAGLLDDECVLPPTSSSSSSSSSNVYVGSGGMTAAAVATAAVTTAAIAATASTASFPVALEVAHAAAVHPPPPVAQAVAVPVASSPIAVVATVTAAPAAPVIVAHPFVALEAAATVATVATVATAIVPVAHPPSLALHSHVASSPNSPPAPPPAPEQPPTYTTELHDKDRYGGAVLRIYSYYLAHEKDSKDDGNTGNECKDGKDGTATQQQGVNHPSTSVSSSAGATEAATTLLCVPMAAATTLRSSPAPEEKNTTTTISPLSGTSSSSPASTSSSSSTSSTSSITATTTTAAAVAAPNATRKIITAPTQHSPAQHSRRAASSDSSDPLLSCGVHADLGLVTVAPRATVPGLMVWNLGAQAWQEAEAHAEVGDVTVFAGETLGAISHGMIRAPLHKVPQIIAPTGKGGRPDASASRRMSMPFFLRGRPGAVMPRVHGLEAGATVKDFMQWMYERRAWRQNPLIAGKLPDY